MGRTVHAPVVTAAKRGNALDLSTAAPGASYLVATSQDEQRISRIMVQR